MTQGIGSTNPNIPSKLPSSNPKKSPKEGRVFANTRKPSAEGKKPINSSTINPDISKNSRFSQVLAVISRVFQRIISYLGGSKSTPTPTPTPTAIPLTEARQRLNKTLKSLCGDSYEDDMDDSLIIDQILTSKMHPDEISKSYQFLETILKRISTDSKDDNMKIFDALLSWISNSHYELQTDGKFDPKKLTFEKIKLITSTFLNQSRCRNILHFYTPTPSPKEARFLGPDKHCGIEETDWPRILSDSNARQKLIEDLQKPNFF